jgi:hypothetical protein
VKPQQVSEMNPISGSEFWGAFPEMPGNAGLKLFWFFENFQFLLRRALR